MVALPSARNGNDPVFTSRPAARASSSDSPTDAICGRQKVTLGMSSMRTGSGSCPAMCSTATTASWLATWASAKPGTMSPMAYMPGAPVRMNSSTLTYPRSTAMPWIVSRPIPSVSGRRPTATRITSAVTSVRLAPSLVATWKLTSFSPFLIVSGSMVEPTWMAMPRLRKTRFSSLPISGSSSGTTRSAYSISVTSAPKSRYMLAHSTPMAPAPTIATRPGASLRSSASSDVMISRPSGSRPGSERGALPVARMRLVPVASTSPDSPPLTRTLVGPVRVPLPRRTVTLFFFIRNSTPETCLSTTASRRLPSAG